jgi:hypothetical protein
MSAVPIEYLYFCYQGNLTIDLVNRICKVPASMFYYRRQFISIWQKVNFI